ncbi:MAG: hypothetical protein HY363_04315 [Candidatus Aenigmarchaeota archaeon]|nr:hypothetical protein [Candidatus Aenigmarchaeota archaeon]
MKLDSFVLVVLVIGAVGALYLRNVPFTGGNVDVDAPPLRTSYDVFANTEHVKWIVDSEQSYFLAPARAGGIRAINAQNPLYYVLIASFTKLTNVSPYQTTYFVLNLLSVFYVLCVFVIFQRAFGGLVALVASFFGFFPHVNWLFPMYIGFQYDYHTYQLLAGIFFLVLYLFTVEKKKLFKDIFVFTLIGVLLAGITLSHYSELFFYVPFIALASAVCLFFYRDYPVHVKLLVFSIPFIIFTGYFLYYYPLTLNVHLSGGFGGQIANQINPERAKHVEYFPWPRFNTVLNILSLLGIGVVLLMIVSKKLDTKRVFVVCVLLYILFVGTSNYTFNVWANRAERQLFLGQSFLVLLPALGIMGVASLLSRNNKTVMFIVMLASTIIIPYFVYGQTYAALEGMAESTYFNDDKWDVVRWVRDNTDSGVRVFFLSGFIHEFQMFAERVELKGDLNLGHAKENIVRVCGKEWPETVVGDWGFRDPPGNGFLTKRTGWNKFEYQLPFQNTTHPFTSMSMTSKDVVPITFFDYVVLQYKGTEGFDNCMQWLINESLARNYTIAYSNPTMMVVRR